MTLPGAERSTEADVLDPDGYAEVRITVRLPGACTESGEPMRYGYTQLMAPDEVRMAYPGANLPHTIEGAARSIMLSLRIR